MKFVTFVGGGGKSSFIELLALSCLSRNKTVVLTTTTKIFAHEPFLLFDDPGGKSIHSTSFVRIGKTVENGKLTALALEEVRELGDNFDVVLIEADGAKGRPLKYPEAYEPVVPSFSDMVLIMAGLDALFRPFREVVFRHELFCSRTAVEEPRLVYPDVFLRFFSDDALLKNTTGLLRTVVLNKYDTLRHRHLAAMLMERILRQTGIDKGLITGLKHGVCYEIGNR